MVLSFLSSNVFRYTATGVAGATIGFLIGKYATKPNFEIVKDKFKSKSDIEDAEVVNENQEKKDPSNKESSNKL